MTSKSPRVTIEIEVDSGNAPFSPAEIAVAMRRHVVVLTPAMTPENNGTITCRPKVLVVDGVRYDL